MTSGWESKKLGDIADISAGNSAPQAKRLFAGGTHPFFRTSDAGRIRFGEIREATDHLNDDGIMGLRRFPKGTILFPKSGASTFLNHRVMLGVEGFVSSHLATIVSDETQLDPRFLLYFLTTVSTQDMIQDHNYPSLNLPSIAGIPVQYPPVPEQQRIVSILDEAFGAIATARANTEKNLRNARELLGAATESLFPAVTRGQAGARTLAELCDLIVDCEHKTAPTQDEGIPSIRTPNIGQGRLILVDVNRVSDDTYRAWTRRAEPRAGDLILAREAPAGNVAVIPDGLKVCLGQRTVLLRPDRSVFEPAYLAHLLLQRDSQRRLLAGQRGATVQHVNVQDIRAFGVSGVPSLVVQQGVVQKIDALLENGDALEAGFQRKLAALDALKQSLLHQAFTGAL